MEVAPPGEYDKLLQKYDGMYEAELGKLRGDEDRLTKEKIASTRAWLNLVNDAKQYFKKFTKAEGNEVILAVIREKSHDKKGEETILVDAQDAANPFRPTQENTSIRPDDSPAYNK
jgi:hypothetical protein